MDWREWAYQKISTDPDFQAIFVPEAILGAGSLTERPNARPYMVLKFGNTTPNIGGSTFTELFVWVHDEPGDYGRIDSALRLVRAKLSGQVSDPSGISCNWQGDSVDLADDTFGTITRNSSYQLVGRDQ